MDNQAANFSHTLGSNNEPFTWFHLLTDEHTSITTLDSLCIPKAAKEGLIADETRPKCVEIEHGLLIYLRAINFNRLSEPDDMVSLRIWLTKDLVISATKQGRGLKSIEEIQTAINSKQPIKDVGAWFCTLLEKISFKVSEQVDEIDNMLEELEEKLHTEPDNINRETVVEVRKQAAKIKRFISPQREALDVLHYSCDFISQIQRFRIKEQSDRVLRYIDELELIRERSILMLEELRYIVAEQQNKRMYVLSIVTAIFLPLSFLTGVFGMNVSGLPGVEHPSAFIILLVCMLAVALIIFMIMKIKRWI